MLGTIIGEKYRLEQSIGTGGMGEVFQARHLVTGRAVAVKLLYEQRPANEAAASDRFRHEAYAAGTLDAEHIVQVFDAGTDRATRRRYLVMELLHGESLHDLIKRIGPLPPDLAFCIVGQAALGLSKAHAAGVVHRDVKPANIFLSLEADEVIVKVLDFGIAKVKELDEQNDASQPESEAIVGSPHYMSPEQAQGLPSLDHRSDLFSLGAVLYRLLSGQTPHPAADTLVRLMYAICSESARPVNEAAPWVPPEMVAVVSRAIAISPSLRFQSAGEMAHAIASIIGDLRIAPSDIAPVSAEARAGLEPASVRRSLTDQEVALSARAWDQTLQGSATHGAFPRSARGARFASRSHKGALGTAILGAIALVLALAALTGLWRTRALGPRATNAALPQGGSSSSLAGSPSGAGGSTATRTVWVRVQAAADDEILVDGHRAKLTATGYAEIVGPLGSQHDVAARVGMRTTSIPVLITNGGAVPDTVTFSASSNAASSNAASSNAASSNGGAKPKPRPRRPQGPTRVDAPVSPESASPPPADEPLADPFGGLTLPTKSPFDD